MGMGIEVIELIRYESSEGCRHHVVLRAGRPSYSGAVQTEEDAAEDFVNESFERLRIWFERWRLPKFCPCEHSITRRLRADLESVCVTEADFDLLMGSGFRWVVIWLADLADRLILGSAESEASFWQAMRRSDGAHILLERVYLLTDQGANGSLRES
ncbi:hypothetical protein ABT272_44830 [Streptomyces sp900105245]|uniref:Uncharacterized protein n=1 Tax=Streptomyces sp. 900105245 TaxID=3154379 RepID=A0ABV1UN33_9ACTN